MIAYAVASIPLIQEDREALLKRNPLSPIPRGRVDILNRCCLTTDWILSCFSDRKNLAEASYREFVQAGKNQPSPWENFKNQIYLGTDEFVEDMQSKLNPEQSLKDIPKKQKRAHAKPLNYYKQQFSNRQEAMAKAYLSGHYTLSEVGNVYEITSSTI